jgi:DNA-binding HxlR family transcriptional regulator
VRSHGQYCPIAKGAEVLGDRWTLLIARELLHGVDHFSELERCLPGISRSVLAERLHRLDRAGIVERVSTPAGRTTRYALSPAGRALRPVVQTIGEWGATWAFGDPDPSELDADLLMRWISRHVAGDQLPDRRVVVRFNLARSARRRYWLVLERGEASVCLHDPGFGTDVTVETDVETLYRVYLGKMTLAGAIQAGKLSLAGSTRMVRAFPRWFRWSSFAPAIRAAAARDASGEVRIAD